MGYLGTPLGKLRKYYVDVCICLINISNAPIGISLSVNLCSVETSIQLTKNFNTVSLWL